MLARFFKFKVVVLLTLQIIFALLCFLMGNIEFFDKKPYVQKQAIPAYSFRSLLSPEFDKVDNFKLQSYVLSTRKSVPPYYFVAYEPSMDSFVSSSKLETGGFFDQFVHHIFDWH